MIRNLLLKSKNIPKRNLALNNFTLVKSSKFHLSHKLNDNPLSQEPGPQIGPTGVTDIESAKSNNNKENNSNKKDKPTFVETLAGNPG